MELSSDKITIAIDGYSSTGKSTLAKRLASALSYLYVDSGAMYRAVTLLAIRNEFIEPDGSVKTDDLVDLLSRSEISFRIDGKGKNRTFLNGEDVEKQIRSMRVSSAVSPVSAVSGVRRLLVDRQQQMGLGGGVVMDGRDIGTVVFPAAELKIFMTASPEIRSQRRFEELKSKGIDDVTLREVAENLAERDMIDSSRSDSPLTQADDARLLDNTNLGPDEQFDLALAWAQEEILQKKERNAASGSV